MSEDPILKAASESAHTLAQVLLSPQAIRIQSQKILELALNGQTHFKINNEKLNQVADYVLDVISENYPDHNVPYHSRWRHFEVGESSELKQYKKLTENLSAIEQARCGMDLIVPSVLIDAGAGDKWRYQCRDYSSIGRSEGLALASLDMFLAGAFTTDQSNLLQTTASGLQAISKDIFCKHFQVTEENALLGVEGRVYLLNELARVILHNDKIFPNHRLGELADYILASEGQNPSAEGILKIVLNVFGDIWPGRITLSDLNLGDTWAYKPLGESNENLVPFHKLSQWLSYSIIETLEQCGFTVIGVEQLTGLAEYRNGGLLLDSELITLKNPEDAQTTWLPGDEIIIEWRALTICMLDQIAQKIRGTLNKSEEEFPLVKTLEGGTWNAGRKLAKVKRGDLSSPLKIASDATVF